MDARDRNLISTGKNRDIYLTFIQVICMIVLFLESRNLKDFYQKHLDHLTILRNVDGGVVISFLCVAQEFSKSFWIYIYPRKCTCLHLISMVRRKPSLTVWSWPKRTWEGM